MRTNNPLIYKASGEQEEFSAQKLENSLKRAGADIKAVNSILAEINSWIYDGVSTKLIYKKAFKLLSLYKNGIAARYSLKRAIMELGPTGYPFEHFIGHVFEAKNLKTEISQYLNGKCVKHEVDVVATAEGFQYFVECKYYNSQGKYVDVKVPMYIHSRFEDIVKKRIEEPEYKNFKFQGWIVTNTRFTTDAIDYALCTGLELLGWDFPKGKALKELIEREDLFPITVLTTLPSSIKHKLLEKGIVLCKQINEKPEILDKYELTTNKKEKIMEELFDLFHYKFSI